MLRNDCLIELFAEEKTGTRRFDAEAAFEKLRKRNRHRLAVRVGMAAASVAILLGVFGCWRCGDDGERAVVKQKYPGAQLFVVEDGRKFELKILFPCETGNGVIQVDAKGVVLGADAKVKKSEDGYNTLFIPRGGEYHLTLSDGTLVWLNSESELYFPMQFKGDSRQVYLKGEAYFDVKSNPRKPFIVKTSAGDVRVLGTAFNVMIYDTTRLVATLERGAISYAGNLQSEVVLRPGEQLTHSVRNNQVRAEKVNTRIYGMERQLVCLRNNAWMRSWSCLALV
ncbi:MAG: FecR family protein [Butyricimonas faecihominis]